MRRGRIIIFVVLIIIIGLVVGVVALQAFLSSSTQTTEPQFVDVYIAGQNIPQGGDINEAVLDTISLPADKVVGVMFTTAELPQLLQNKVARFNLDQGVVLTESMITDKSTGGVLIAPPQWASLIPPGMTAIGIPTTRLSVAGYGVNDGAHVNVNACFLFVDVDPSFQSALPNSTAVLTGTGFVPDTLPIVSLGATVPSGGATNPQGRLELDPSLQQPFYLVPSETQRPRVVCQTIFQDVVVMKLGNFVLPQATVQSTDPEVAPQPVTTEAQPKPDIVTLIVSPQDSITLSYLVYTNAQIMLALRNSSDTTRQSTEAATLQFLLSQYNIPIPAKLPYALQPRIDALAAPSLPNDIVTVPPQQ